MVRKRSIHFLRKQIILTSIGPCIANIFAEYNQQDATFHNFFISVRSCTCFRRYFRPSSKLHIQSQVFVRPIYGAECAVLSS